MSPKFAGITKNRVALTDLEHTEHGYVWAQSETYQSLESKQC